MIKTRLKAPYTKGKCTFKARNKAGVYLIYKNTELVYVGYSASNCYKSFYRHFQSWNDKRQQRVVYNPTDESIKTRIIYTNTAAQADKLEKALIIKYRPKDNIQQYWLNYETDSKEEEIYDFYKSCRTSPEEEEPF